MRATAWTARLLLVALALVLLGTSTPKHADDNFGITPEKKLAKELKKFADVCYKCGEKAKDKGLYTFARSFFDHALRYDPDHKKTRKVMGFKKKRRVWVLEEDMIPLKDKVAPSKLRQVIQSLWDANEKIRSNAADRVWAFVAKEKLKRNQRLLALHHTLVMFPNHRLALRAARASMVKDPLGFMRVLHHLDDEGETNRAQWIDRAKHGDPVEEATEYDNALGLKCTKVSTPYYMFHFRIGAESEGWAKTTSQFAEASRTRLAELSGVDEKPPKESKRKLHFSVFKERETFAKFVEKCSGITDPSHRAEVAKYSGGSDVFKPWGAVWYLPDVANDHGLRDALAHDIGAKLIFKYCRNAAYWLARGVGYYMSTQMNGSVKSKFYGVLSSSVIETGGDDIMPGLGNSTAGWRFRISMDVASGTLMSLKTLANTRVNDIKAHHMAFAFCLAEYLLREHKDAFKDFLDSAREEVGRRIKAQESPDETPNEMLVRMLKALGQDENEFIGQFSKWVQESYIKLPAKDE